MKRIALFSIATIVALFSSACERFPSTQLPEHYKHKMHASTEHSGGAGEHAAPAGHGATEAPKH